MKMNGTTVKIIAVFVVVVAVIVWAVTSTSSQTFSGSNLSFGVQGGPVSLTNSSDQPVPVVLAGTGTRAFRVVSSMEGVSGSSTRLGTGSAVTQTFAFDLVPGASDLTITGGTNVIFTATTDSTLQAVVSPMSADGQRTTIIAAVVISLVALFYASSVTQHGWIKMLRGKLSPAQNENIPVPEPETTVTDGGQGRSVRSYGDNRAQP